MPTSPPRAANDPAAPGERRTVNSRSRPAGAAPERSPSGSAARVAKARMADPAVQANPAAAPGAAHTAGPGPDLAREAVIRLHAYRLWERRGGSHGHAVDDWLQAEQELGHLGGMATARLPRSRAEGAR